MDLNRATAENLKRIRKERKLSMERTAELAGVSRSMLSQIERGEANPSVATIGKLAAALKIPAERLLENDDFTSLLLTRVLDATAVWLDGGKAVLRPSLPYDDTTKMESTYLDLYITGSYAPPLSVRGCVCCMTLFFGTAEVTAEGETFHLQERDAIRFAADRPYAIRNPFNGTARMLLTYRYLK